MDWKPAIGSRVVSYLLFCMTVTAWGKPISVHVYTLRSPQSSAFSFSTARLSRFFEAYDLAQLYGRKSSSLRIAVLLVSFLPWYTLTHKPFAKRTALQ